MCFTAQYLFSDPESQVQTPGIPMLKYSATSNTYKRLLWNFDWIWKNYKINYDAVQKSLREKPIVTIRKNC